MLLNVQIAGLCANVKLLDNIHSNVSIICLHG